MSEETQVRKVSKFRFIVCAVVWFDLLSSYTCRINLSVGILGIVKQMHQSTGYKMSEEMQNYLLMAFNIGYLLLHIPGALLCILYGSRKIMLCSLFFTSVFTFLSVPAAMINEWLFFAARILVGAAGATIIPIVQQCVANHAHPSERTFYFLAILTGNIGSLILMLPLGGYLVGNFTKGWQYVFYITGGLTGIAFVLHYFFVYESPEENPWFSEEEKEYILNAIYPDGRPDKKTIGTYPWKSILTSKHTYYFMCSHFGKLLIFYMNLFGLVKYFRSYYNMTVMESSVYSIIPFTIDFLVHFVYHFIVDKMKEAKWSMTKIRRVNTLIGSIGCSAFLLGLAFVPPENKILGIFVSSLGLCMIPAFQAGYFAAIIDYAPQYTLVTMSIINVAGSFAGVFQRYMTGIFIKHAENIHIGYRNIYIFTALVSLASCMIYVLFGTASIQPWANVKREPPRPTQEVTQ